MEALKRLLGNLSPYLLLLSIGVLAVMSLGPRDLLTQFQLSTRATAPTLGTVQTGERIRGAKSRRYYLVVRYEAPHGPGTRSFVVRRQVEPSLYRDHPSGSSIRLRYVMAAPEVATVADSRILPEKGRYAMGLFAMIGLLSVVFAGMIRHARAQLPPHGPGLA